MSSTGHKYVYKAQAGKPYWVSIKVRNRNYCVGYFATIPEGVAAARGFNKALKFFGPTWRFVRK
jgi:hypothetical protein